MERNLIMVDFSTTVNRNNTTGWVVSVSDARESITTPGQVIRCAIGGFVSASPEGHYARARRDLAVQDGIVVPRQFTIAVDFSLPNNFYTDPETNIRLMGVDNALTVLNGQPVGSNTRWRVYLGMFGSVSDFTPFLVSEYVNVDGDMQQTYPWFLGSRLPAGSRHQVSLTLDPGVNNDGSYTVVVDGVTKSEQHVAFLPGDVPTSDIVVTGISAGLEGTRADMKRVTVDLHSLTFTTPV